MRYARKDVEKFVAFVQKAAVRPLNVYMTSGSHIGFCDAETGVPIRHPNGHALVIAGTPSSPNWMQAAIRSFVDLGLIRESLLEAAKRRSKADRDADEAVRLRADLRELRQQIAAKERRLDKLDRAA